MLQFVFENWTKGNKSIIGFAPDLKQVPASKTPRKAGALDI